MSRAFDGLLPDTTYAIDCVEVDSEGKYLCKEYNHSVLTKPDAPLLRAIDVQSCKNVIVAWDAPHDNGGLPVQGYELHYYSDPTQELVVLNISGNTTERELDNLLPGTEYTFVIKATTSIATDNNNTLSNTTHFRGSADDILIATQNKSRMINITSKNGTPFVCWINRTRDEHENYTVNETTTVEGLQPDTLYSIDCVEINSKGEYQCRKFNTTLLTENLSIEMQPFSSTGAHLLIWPQYNNTVNYSCSLTALQAENYTKSTIELNNTLSELSPNTTYSVWCLVYEEDRERELCYEGRAEGRTFPLIENITATNITAASTVITWNTPPHNYNYTIWLESRVADNFTYWNSSIILTSPTSRSSYTLTDLDSFRNYSISMYLELSNLGNGTDSEEPFETQGKEPTSTPNNRTVNMDKKFATLQWRIPSISGRNGIITNYSINWRSHGSAQAQKSPIIYNLTNPSFTHPEDIRYTLSSLTPYTNYTWRVAAVNEKGVGPFSEWNNFTTDEDKAGVPYDVSVWAVTSAGPGNKTQYAETIFTKELTPNASVSDVVITWTGGDVVNISWEALPLRVARGNPQYTVNVTSRGVVVWSGAVNTSSVQVPGLSRTTVYSVVVRVSTLEGQGNYSEPVSFGTEPAEDSNVPVVAGIIAVVIAALAVVICIAVCIVVRRRRSRKVAIAPNEELPLRPLYRDNTEEPQGQRREPISRDNFCAHVKHMHQDKSKPFKDEFSSVLQAPDATHTAAQNNPLRNRYVNIYPCPIQSTVADFWEMIWEHKSPVIVMLTRLKEGDRPKCIQYWSEEINIPYEPGRNLSVVTTRMDTTPSYEMRHFEVTKTSEKSSPLKVKQFLYTAWPDHGVPQYSSSMVKFIMEQIRPEVQNSSAPIIVHCSAGAGRTGTLIAIDTTIDRLEEEEDINIFECVELMRARRTQMVQNVNQYMYIHDAINDYVSCGNTTIVAHELGPKIALLSTKNPGQDKTGYEQQFQALEDLSPVFSDADRSFALKAEAKDKIRYTDRFTYSDNCIRTEIKEKYVNATQIKGYYGQNHFIAAQAPMKKTVEDTWNVIREQDCKVVVVLCKLTDEDDAELEMSCIQFCPSEPGKTTSTDSYTFTALRVDQTAGYTTTEVSSVVEDEEPVLITVYQYKNWKKNGRPEVSSLLRLMGDVQRSLSSGGEGSLMVMCDDGMSRTGVFITVMSEIDRVKVEGEMDIFQTIKAARTARPYMVSTVVDYEVCHEIIHNYLESFDTYANFK
uniref:Receptor-type tyrosine-protein phosphatase-like protein n=1 Tax=Halisarca dujardinii TaxID=2583056 RepID=A0AA96MKH6_HALDU|nr:receptor-type tyrosine-protein phosphatase-like protein [Halisarca dujardinii]